jgi:hypothetical protein
MDVDTVGAGGKLTGAVLDSFGRPPRGIRGTTRRRREKHSEMAVERPASSSTVRIGDNKGQAIGTIGTQINYSYIQGPSAQVPDDNRRPLTNLIEETIRLDVAVPHVAIVDEAFSVVIAVRRPEAPPLSERDLPHVVSATGSVFREEADSVVSYRIELAGDGFRVEPKKYQVKLRPRENSVPVAFQVTSTKTGIRTLIVTAYQQDDSVAAQTRCSIQVKVAVSVVS